MNLLIIHSSFANPFLLQAALAPLLGFEPISLANDTFLKTFPDSSIPRIKMVNGNMYFVFRGETRPLPDLSEFLARNPVVSLFPYDIENLPSSFFRHFDFLISLLRSPFATLEYRTKLYFNDQIQRNHGPKRPFKSYSHFIFHNFSDFFIHWRREVAWLLMLKRVLGIDLFLLEWFEDPAQGIHRLCEAIGSASHTNSHSAERNVKSVIDQCIDSLKPFLFQDRRALYTESILERAAVILNRCAPVFGPDYLSFLGTPTPMEVNCDAASMFSILDPRNDFLAMDAIYRAVYKFLPNHPGSTVVHIPARANSTRLVKKNVALVNGLPLLAHTILQARRLRGVDRIILNTDSEEFAKLGKQYGSESPFLRPSEISTEKSSMFEAHSILLWWLCCEGSIVERLVSMYPTSPCRNIQKIQSMLDSLREFPQVRSVATCYATTLSKSQQIHDKPLFEKSSRPKYCFKETGHFIGMNLRLLRTSTDTLLYFHDKLEERIDIDSQDDLDLLLGLTRIDPGLLSDYTREHLTS